MFTINDKEDEYFLEYLIDFAQNHYSQFITFLENSGVSEKEAEERLEKFNSLLGRD